MQSRVSEFEPGRAWYEKLLGRGPTFAPPPPPPGGGVAEWELYPGCWLAVLQAEPDPGSNRIRFGVRDLYRERARLRTELGIEVTEPWVLEGIGAHCDFEDPYGNRLGLFQDLAIHPL